MNRVVARTMDKLALSVFAPSFTPLDETIIKNKALLHEPIVPPGRNFRIPKMFQKRIKTGAEADIFHFTFESQTITASSRDNTVHGRYFKLNKRQPESTAILLHGLCEHSYRHVNRYAYRLINGGYDCVTMALPYHMERSNNWSLVGRQLMGPDMRAMLEGLRQATKDVLCIAGWLTSHGDKQIGVVGINLGAYIAALVSSITRRLDYAILIAPLTSPIQAIGFELNRSGSPSSKCLLGLSTTQLQLIMNPWELSCNLPVIPKKRVMIAAATHSPFSPIEATTKLWQEWGMPQMQEYEHGYMGLRWSRRVIEDIIDFLDTSVSNQRSAGFR